MGKKERNLKSFAIHFGQRPNEIKHFWGMLMKLQHIKSILLLRDSPFTLLHCEST